METSEIGSTTGLYAEKQDAYYDNIRRDIVDLIPPATRRLLDIGCGSGATAAFAKTRLSIGEVYGVESYKPAAERARSLLDGVLITDVETLGQEAFGDKFDCIVLADVLEHLKDPWRALRIARSILSEDGVILASIPNIRHIVPLLKIFFNRLEYEESGILDRTHLRSFTLHTIRELFASSGLHIEHIVRKKSASWKFRCLTLVTLGLFREFSVYQYLIIARIAK